MGTNITGSISRLLLLVLMHIEMNFKIFTVAKYVRISLSLHTLAKLKLFFIIILTLSLRLLISNYIFILIKSYKT